MQTETKKSITKSKIHRKFPVFSLIGTVMTGILEFSYALGLFGRYSNSVDFGVIGLFMFPIFLGFYWDRELFKRENKY